MIRVTAERSIRKRSGSRKAYRVRSKGSADGDEYEEVLSCRISLTLNRVLRVQKGWPGASDTSEANV